MEKKKTMARLKKIEGQVRALGRMVEEGAHCVEILTQLAAVTAAMKKAGLHIVNSHLHDCLTEIQKGNRPDMGKKAVEINQILTRYLSVV